MRVLLIELYLTGHHFKYLCKIVDVLIDLRCQVAIMIAEDSTELNDLYGHNECVTIEKYSLPSKINNRNIFDFVRNQINFYRLFKKIYEQRKKIGRIDFVVLPYIDYCLYSIGLLGNPFSGSKTIAIAMRPNFHFPHYGINAPRVSLRKVKEILTRRCAENIHRLFSIDELLVDYMTSKHKSIREKLIYMPDPSEMPQINVGESIHKSNTNGKYTILIFGAIDCRKGVVELIDALDARGANSSFQLQLMGKQSEEVRSLIRGDRWKGLKKSGLLHFEDRYVSDAEEESLIRQADIIWVAYKNHYSMSGILVSSIRYDKIIIACNEGLIGWYSSKYKKTLFTNLNINHINQVLDLFIVSLHDLNSCKRSVDGFFANNNWEFFKSNMKLAFAK